MARKIDRRPRQPFIAVPDRKALYIRVPKAGSTTIRAWLVHSSDLGVVSFGKPLPIFASRRFFTFTFVRNPYDRIASAWADKVVKGGYSLGGLGDGEPDLGEFVRRVAASDLSRVNAHVRPQSELLRRVKVDFLGRVESMRDDQLRLAELLDLPRPPDNRRNESKKPRTTDLFDARTAELVSQVYSDDFRLFGYDATLPRQ